MICEAYRCATRPAKDSVSISQAVHANRPKPIAPDANVRSVYTQQIVGRGGVVGICDAPAGFMQHGLRWSIVFMDANGEYWAYAIG